MYCAKWIFAAGLLLAADPAFAGPECHGGQSFEQFLASVRAEAEAAGVSKAAVASALDGVHFDESVIRRDHGQGVFQQTFLQFSDRMVSADRMSRGKKLLASNAALFSRIERQYGVPAEVLVAFWGLESDFGADHGKFPVIQSVATLAYDCRRADVFHVELLNAIKLVERGLSPSEMVGDWAGELGHMQISPPQYVKYGVDFDGDGKSDVIHSIPDAMATAANFLVGAGWQRGQPWLQEVRVPANLPWQEADLAIQHPRAYWVQQGVSAASGDLPADKLPASLVLPMGRSGPAFLAYPNFGAYLEWNKAYVYSLTAGYFATRLAGAPVVSHASRVAPLAAPELKELQLILRRMGLSNEVADGRLGTDTRAAVKQAQLKLGLPADGYPTADLLQRLRGQ
ncbi:MAG: lytic murein transglycosylase [Ancalomicrobiaceae bacterium]|nr:lytic murein transglycosylase [Ancalomicrobiaceae bacterium]